MSNIAETTAQKIARESSDFGWELSPEFVEALADEIGRANEQGENEGFNGVETFLAYFGGAVQNARF